MNLDGPVGFGASFLEEAFGGLVRAFGLAEVKRKLVFEAHKRAYLLPRIERDMADADRGRPTVAAG